MQQAVLNLKLPYPIKHVIRGENLSTAIDTTVNILTRVYHCSLKNYNKSKAQENIIAAALDLVERGVNFPAVNDIAAVIGAEEVLSCLLLEKFGTNPVRQLQVAQNLCYLQLPLSKVPVLVYYILNLIQAEKLQDAENPNFSFERSYSFLGMQAVQPRHERGVLMFAAINLFRWILTDEAVRGPAFVTLESRIKLVTHPALQKDYLEMNNDYLKNDKPTDIKAIGFLYRSEEQAKRWANTLD